MAKIKSDTNSRIFFIIMLLAMVVLVFLIIKPFIITIITSGILAYIFYPVHKRIYKKLKGKNLSAFITTLLVIIVITVPLLFAMNAVTKEARVNYIIVKQKIMTGELLSTDCDITNAYCKLSHNIKDIISDPRTKYYLDNTTEKITTYIIDGISNFLFSIPIILLNIFIMFFTMFYLFREGGIIAKKMAKLAPLKKLHFKRIFKRFDNIIYSVVFGYILIALIEGFLGAFGLFLLGIKAPILLGFIIAILAIIPVVGPPLVWLPIALLMLAEGFASQTNSLVIRGVILIIYGVLVITPIDTILKPKIIGDRAQVNPILILLGVLGGLKLFGFIGIIIGPVILTIFMTFLQIYEEERGIFFK